MGQTFANQRPGVNIRDAATSLALTGSVVLSNFNGLSFGMSSVPSTASAFTVTMGGGGVLIAAGTQTAAVSAAMVVFSNSNGVSFGLNGQTLTMSAGTRVSFWDSPGERDVAVTLGNETIAAGASFAAQRFSLPYAISATQLDLYRFMSVSGSGAGTYQISAGFFTFSGSTASLVSSVSTQVTFNSGTNSTAKSIYGAWSGSRIESISFPGSTFNFTPGEYMFGILASWSSSANSQMTMSLLGRSSQSIVGAIGGGLYSQYFGDGYALAGADSVNNAALQNISLSNFTQTGVSAVGQPYFRLIGS